MKLYSKIFELLGLLILFVGFTSSVIAANIDKKIKRIDKSEFIQDSEGNSFLKDEVIVLYEDVRRPSKAKKIRFGKNVPAVVEEFARRKRDRRFRYLNDLIKDLSEDVEKIAGVEPNYIAEVLWQPNDPLYWRQWHLDNASGSGINAEKAWDVSTGRGITVAVIDTGVAYEKLAPYYLLAEDLNGACVIPGYDFINNDASANDDHFHGTHVAGTIAQVTNNGVGVAGVAFNACIMPIKVLSQSGFGTYQQVADGIRWAADHGAQVINMSLGGTGKSKALERALAYAYDKGVTIIAAAGNNNNKKNVYPAAYDRYVIAVSATDYLKNKSWYSSFGKFVDVAAPGGDTNGGVDVPVDRNGDGFPDGVLQNTFYPYVVPNNGFDYYYFQGTSMASPHVAGIAALLLAHGNVANPEEVRRALQETARDLGSAGRDDNFGWGLVDALAALNWASGQSSVPRINLIQPALNERVRGIKTIRATINSPLSLSVVQLLIDGNLIASLLPNPAGSYSFDWNSSSVTEGRHGLTVVATNSVGRSAAYSTSILVDNINDLPKAVVTPPGVNVLDGDGDGFQRVDLDAFWSFDPDGWIAAYQWSENNQILGTGERLSYNFTLGDHDVTLKVTDDRGATAQTAVSVAVRDHLRVTIDSFLADLIYRTREASKYSMTAQLTNRERFDIPAEIFFTVSNQLGEEIFREDLSQTLYSFDRAGSLTMVVFHDLVPTKPLVVGNQYTLTLTVLQNSRLLDRASVVVTLGDRGSKRNGHYPRSLNVPPLAPNYSPPSYSSGRGFIPPPPYRF